MDIVKIKELARENLRGKWATIITISLLYSIAGLIYNLIPDSIKLESSYFNIIDLIVDSLLVLGYTNIILNIVRGNDICISMLFDGCSSFFKALGIKIVMFIYVTLWTFILIIPGFMAAIKYSMTFYIWADNPDVGVNEAITRSGELTDGHKLEIFKLLLSFIGWILLAVVPSFIINIWFPQLFDFTFSLGMIIVEPYIAVSMATFYTKLTQDKNVIVQA